MDIHRLKDNEQHRIEIEEHVEQFLANGGVIEQIPIIKRSKGESLLSLSDGKRAKLNTLHTGKKKAPSPVSAKIAALRLIKSDNSLIGMHLRRAKRSEGTLLHPSFQLAVGRKKKKEYTL